MRSDKSNDLENRSQGRKDDPEQKDSVKKSSSDELSAEKKKSGDKKKKKGRLVGGDDDEPRSIKGGADKKSDGSDDEGKSKDEGKKSGLKERLKQIRRTAMLAQAGMKAYSMMQFLLFLKMMLQMLMAMVQAAISAVVGMVMAIVNAVVHGVIALATFLGVTAAVAAGGIVAVVLIVAIAVGVGISTRDTTGQRDTGNDDCVADTSFMASAYGELQGDTMSNAKKAYAFLKAYGLPDTNIAGVLGNWSHESGIDPTSVETIFTEKFLVPAEGTKKYECWMGSYEYEEEGIGGTVWITSEPVDFRLSFTNSVGGRYGLRTYVGSILDREKFRSYSNKYPGIHYLGIGLGQWTNGRNQMLRAYADLYPDYEWYNLELQLMFMVDPNGDDRARVNFLASWGEEPSAREAARTFCERWEGISYASVRGDSAERWMATFPTWQAGVDYDLEEAQSLVAEIATASTGVSNSRGAKALRNCSDLVFADNSSAAAAAVEYAWGPGESSENNGTGCWQNLFQAICGAHDPYYRSCDRTVAVAIKWSGTDSDYPNGSTQDQLRYLMTSSRWKKIDWNGDKANLLPGDVLIRNDNVVTSSTSVDDVGHTLMFVGNELVRRRFGDSWENREGVITSSDGYEFVSGSIDTKSPHVQKWCDEGAGANALSTYFVYRNVEKYTSKPEWTRLTCAGDPEPYPEL